MSAFRIIAKNSNGQSNTARAQLQCSLFSSLVAAAFSSTPWRPQQLVESLIPELLGSVRPKLRLSGCTCCALPCVRMTFGNRWRLHIRAHQDIEIAMEEWNVLQAHLYGRMPCLLIESIHRKSQQAALASQHSRLIYDTCFQVQKDLLQF